MSHLDENTNGTYCQLCKKNLARPEALCGVIYICEKCATSKTINNERDKNENMQKLRL